MDCRFLVDDLVVVNTSEFRALSAVNDAVWTCQADGTLSIRGRSGQVDRTIGDHLKDSACSILKRGPHVWVGYHSGAVRVFHAENLFTVATLEGHGTGPVTQLAVAGGCVFSCATLPGTFELLQWSADKPGLLHHLTLPSSAAPCCALALAPWHKGVACGTDSGFLHVFDGQRKEAGQSLKAHKGAVQALLTARGQFWSGGEDGALKVWDSGSGRLVETLAKHKGPIVAVVGSGDFVLSAGVDRSINVWETASRQFVRTLLGHTGALHGIGYVSAAIKPTFWSSSEDGTLRKWTFDVSGPTVHKEVPRWLGLSHLLPDEEESPQEKEKRDAEARWKMIIQDMETNFQDTVRRYTTEIEALKRDRDQKTKPRTESPPEVSAKGAGAGASDEVKKLQTQLQEMRKQQQIYDRKLKEAAALYEGIQKHSEEIKADYEREIQALRQQPKKGPSGPDMELQRQVQELLQENQLLREQVERGPSPPMGNLDPGGIGQALGHTPTEVYFILHSRADFVAALRGLYGAMGPVRERLSHATALAGKAAGAALGNDIAEVALAFGDLMGKAGAILDQFFTEAEKVPRPMKKQPSGPKSHQSRSLVKAKPAAARERSGSMPRKVAGTVPLRKRSPSPQVKVTARSISPTKAAKAATQSAKVTPVADRRRPSVSPPRRDAFAFFHANARPPVASAEVPMLEAPKAASVPHKSSATEKPKAAASPSTNRHPPKVAPRPAPGLPWPLDDGHEEGPAPRERAPVPTAAAAAPDADRKSPYRRPSAPAPAPHMATARRAAPANALDPAAGDSPLLSSRASSADSPLLETNRSPTRWGVGGPPTFPRPAETPPLPAPAEGGPPARSPGSALVDLMDDGALRAALPRPPASPRVGARIADEEASSSGRRTSPFRAAQREAEEQQRQAALQERAAREAAQREAERREAERREAAQQEAERMRRDQEEREQRQREREWLRAREQEREAERQRLEHEASLRRPREAEPPERPPPPQPLPPPPPRPPPTVEAERGEPPAGVGAGRDDATARPAAPEAGAMPIPLPLARNDSILGLGRPEPPSAHDPRAALQRVKDQHKALLARLRSMEADNESDTATATSQKSDRRRRQTTLAKSGRLHGKGARSRGHTDSDFEVSSTSDSDTSMR